MMMYSWIIQLVIGIISMSIMGNGNGSEMFMFVSGLGSSCTDSGPLGAGTAGVSDPYWMETIAHQGISAFNPNPTTYVVFRNVKTDFGAKGDGVNDDTIAINAAISAGDRCGLGCPSSTVKPAVVYFPAGTYLVSAPILSLYHTQLIGDPKNPPTLLAAAGFSGIAVIDSDPYVPGGDGAEYYISIKNFFRTVRNFVIDVTSMPSTRTGTGIHWQVSQAATLANIVFRMSTAPDTAHQGIFMENGSGGFMSDLVFYGGKYGIWAGNQQFTFRNISVSNAQTAIFSMWNWGWTFQRVNINNCQIGFDIKTGGLTAAQQTSGAIAIIDVTVANTAVLVRTSDACLGRLAGSIVLHHVRLDTNVPVAVGVADGTVVLPGTTTSPSSISSDADSNSNSKSIVIDAWVQGNVFQHAQHSHDEKISSDATDSDLRFMQGSIDAVDIPGVLLDNEGNVFGKPRPQYETYAPDQFVSVRSNGAKGDGHTDDTTALQAVFDKYSGCKIIFFDAGTYIVTTTLRIPADTQIVGEAWSVIAGSGSAFQDVNDPKAVVQVGAGGSRGTVEISDIIFKTIGPAPGAILVQWNVAESDGQKGGAGMWDSHIILGGIAGTQFQFEQCPRSLNPDTAHIESCSAAFLGLHLTPGSTIFMQSTWVWTADFDLDSSNYANVTVYSTRGILSQSAGPVWMLGTASEHHTMYQVNLVDARNHYMGLIQTESPYFLPCSTSSSCPAISPNSAFHDPAYPGGLTSSWAVSITRSQDIIFFGAGLYSFFQHYTEDCSKAVSCQEQIFNIDSSSSVAIYSLSTVGTTYQVSVDGNGIVNQSANSNGFAQTVTALVLRSDSPSSSSSSSASSLSRDDSTLVFSGDRGRRLRMVAVSAFTTLFYMLFY